jgi:hypothetical protein
MKRITIIALLLGTLFACKKSSTDPGGKVWENGTGEWAPYTLGSTFTFEVTTAAPATVDSFTFTVSKDTLMDGLTFKKLQADKPNYSNYYFNYTNDVQKEAQVNFTSNFGVTIPKLVQTNLKPNEAVNANWIEPISLSIPGVPIPITVNFTHTVKAKGISRTVLTKTYTDVIQMQTQAVLQPIPGVPFPPGTVTSITFDNYYAKGVGNIERSAPNQTAKLKRYNIR